MSVSQYIKIAFTNLFVLQNKKLHSIVLRKFFHFSPIPHVLHAVSRFTETSRNGPKRAKKDRNGLTKIPKRTSRSTETGLNKGRVGQGRARQGWAGTYFVPTYLLRIRVPLYLPNACLLYTYLPNHPPTHPATNLLST